MSLTVEPNSPQDPSPNCLPAISVIIPVYNVENYLERTLQSVLDQDFADWELIVVDDASSDNSLQIAQSFAKREPRMRVIALEENTPGGAGIPSNIGLEEARGRYIAFLDSDDLYYPDYLGTLYHHAELFAQVDIAMIRYRIHYVGSGRMQTSYPDAWGWNHLLRPKLDARNQKNLVRYLRYHQTHSCMRHRIAAKAWSRSLSFFILYGLGVVPWRKLYRRDFLREHNIRFPESQYFFEDVPLHWKVCSLAEHVLFCDTVAYQHNMGRTGQTIGDKPERQIAAKLFQAEQTLQDLLKAIEAGKLGQGGEFYLLLWLRDLLYTFCHGLRLAKLEQWQDFYLASEDLLCRYLQQSRLLRKTLVPLYKLHWKDLLHLRLDFFEACAWSLFLLCITKEPGDEEPEDLGINRVGSVEAASPIHFFKGGRECGKVIRVFLFFLHLPLLHYTQAAKERLRYGLSKLR